MVTQLVRQQIRAALSHEEATGQLAAHLRRTLLAQAEEAGEATVAQAVRLARSYVDQVPVLLEELTATCAALGALPAVAPLLEGAAGYFLEPHDLIPDHLGLLGLLDDAYLAHRLLETLSEQYRQLTGSPLLSVDLSAANRVVRKMIGAGVADRLDLEVAQAIQRLTYQATLANLGQIQYAAPTAAAGARGSWGPAFEDRVAQFCAENGISLNW